MSSARGGPPGLARQVLRLLLPAREREEVLGDLAEYHAHLVRTRGRLEADRWYLVQALTAPLYLRLAGRTGRRMGTGGLTMGRAFGFELHHLRLALRRCAREPGFTAVTVLTVALGIGATTAVYSVVDGVLLEPLPYEEPDRLVTQG